MKKIKNIIIYPMMIALIGYGLLQGKVDSKNLNTFITITFLALTISLTVCVKKGTESWKKILPLTLCCRTLIFYYVYGYNLSAGIDIILTIIMIILLKLKINKEYKIPPVNPNNKVIQTSTTTQIVNGEAIQTQKLIVNGEIVNTTTTVNGEVQQMCPKCSKPVAGGLTVCPNCNTQLTNPAAPVVPQEVYLTTADLNPELILPENIIVQNAIKRELDKASIPKGHAPKGLVKKKVISGIIFSSLVFVYVSLIFFHFPVVTYFIGAIILLIVGIKSLRINKMRYFEKELKSRPSEKISNIIMNETQNAVVDLSILYKLLILIAGITLPLLVFWTPKIIYEETEGGYAVRYYIFGVTEYETAEIPEKHNDKNVVSLRGNAFSNMFYLKEVKLPNTIYEIRGQAFKNDEKLEKVNLPSNLITLGGGAFYNCISLKNINIPEGVTSIGGEAFYGASSLESILLPEGLTEIRGDTFNGCKSLTSVNIPDKVTRIGGHAFYQNYNLSNVTISKNSQLEEIGSSAFRECRNLYSITLPNGVYVNERAFKESPTQISYYNY